MWQLFKQDVQRWIFPQVQIEPITLTFRTIIRLWWRHLPVRAMLWFRFGSWCKQHRLPFMTGLTQRFLYRFFGLEIRLGADIGGGLYIPHPVGTVIVAKRIGKNCSIIANVTIGMRNEWDFPEIGDNVFIGAGARVLGGIKVGDNAVIGANAVVIHDVPAGATVVGIPAKEIIKKSQDPQSLFVGDTRSPVTVDTH